MTDRFKIVEVETERLKKELAPVDWGTEYGSFKVQIRQGKAVTVTKEQTFKLD